MTAGSARGWRRFAATGCVVSTLVVTASQPTSVVAGGPTYAVMNTSETLPDGVYFRNSPNWTDTSKTFGLGVFMNEQVELECYAVGQPIGPFGNALWYYAVNTTRPVNYNGAPNEGMLDAHYIADGQPANVVDAGVPACVNNLPPAEPHPTPATLPTPTPARQVRLPRSPVAPPPGEATNPTPTPPTPASSPSRAMPQQVTTSVFYSPNSTSGGLPGLAPADLNLPLSSWSSGTCNPAMAGGFSGAPTTLAGWSLARLGPIYFLLANPTRAANVHTVILFDPGATSNFAPPSLWAKLLGVTTCDWRFNINGVLARWLSSNTANRLMILTGRDSEEKDGSRSTFAGLWSYYLAGIWNQPFADQAQVCDYDNMGHPEVLASFATVVAHPPTSCPPGPQLTAWNP